MTWAAPGSSWPLLPSESAWRKWPPTTYVSDSMSWWGWSGHSAPGTIRSSLKTRNAPTPMWFASR